VQAFPGGTTRTDAGGVYVVGAPPASPIEIVATRLTAGSVTPGSIGLTTGAIGTTTMAADLTLLPAPGALTYTIRAQLVRGRDVIGVRRDEAIVRIIAGTTPSPTPVNGAVVQIRNTASWVTLPALNASLYGAGSYGILSGLANGSITLVRDSTYSLRVDLDADGTFDATASVRMPGQPAIVAPSEGAVMDSAFACTWTDDASGITGYSASYVGSFESDSLGAIPARFVVASPALTQFVGDGVRDVAHHMPNDPLPLGPFTFRLWAFNGPIQYALPDTTLFTTPNVTGTNVTGWFSAFAQADSVGFRSLGINGTRPAAQRRDRGQTALLGRPR
jgi:hypothetical protein